MKSSTLGTVKNLLLLAAVATAGPTGATGEQGATGGPLAGASTAGWNLYRSYDFAAARDDIRDADRTKAAQVADHMRKNPTYRVALDGWSIRRVDAVRDALIAAGVPANRIQTGPYGDPQSRTERHVAVLVGN